MIRGKSRRRLEMQRFLSSLPRASLASDSALPAKASKSMPAGDASMTRTVASSSYTSSRSRSKYASSGLALRAAAISSAMCCISDSPWQLHYRFRGLIESLNQPCPIDIKLG